MGKGLTHTARNVRCAGVFVDNGKSPAAGRGALFVNAGEFTRPRGFRGLRFAGARGAGLGPVRCQSERRSPVEDEKTWLSPGRGTTWTVAPFSGTARLLTRTTRSFDSPPTSTVP